MVALLQLRVTLSAFRLVEPFCSSAKLQGVNEIQSLLQQFALSDRLVDYSYIHGRSQEENRPGVLVKKVL
jgi:hypothetical protein